MSTKGFLTFIIVTLSLSNFSPGQSAAEFSNVSKAKILNEKLEQLKRENEQRSRANYQLGPGDIIEITVFNIKELNKIVEISAQGKITLPFIDEVQVEGLTTQELEKKLESLLDARVMKNPQVNVGIKERHSQPVYILGAVEKPGTYQMTRRLNLIDALSLAGGFNSKASDKLYVRKAVSHPVPTDEPDSSTKTIEVDLKDLLVNGNESLNYPIEAGDVINVPQKVEKLFYVLGDVGKPGAYEFKDSNDSVRLSQAIATAGGLLRTAALKHAVIVRPTDNGGKTQIALDLKKMLKGNTEDVLIKPNDLIFVPNSATKNAREAILNGLTTIITTGMFIATR